MNIRVSNADVTQKRMLSEKEAQTYLGLGRSSTRKLGDKIKAIQHIGSRVLYDRYVLDSYLNENAGA